MTPGAHDFRGQLLLGQEEGGVLLGRQGGDLGGARQFRLASGAAIGDGVAPDEDVDVDAALGAVADFLPLSRKRLHHLLGAEVTAFNHELAETRHRTALAFQSPLPVQAFLDPLGSGVTPANAVVAQAFDGDGSVPGVRGLLLTRHWLAHITCIIRHFPSRWGRLFREASE